jgi:hypothetical protein
VKVESDLAPGDDAFPRCYQLFCFHLGSVVVKTGVVRVCAYGGVNERVFPSAINRTFKDAAVRIARADVEDRRNTRIARTLNHLVSILIELWTINMRVRIREHPCSSVAYFRRAPFGTSSVNVAITGRPSSP